MGPDDALRLATWTEGLFSEMTPQQVAFLADQFAPFDVAVVEAEVTRFRRQFETLSIANLLRRLTDEQHKRTPPARRSAADREQADADWKRDDARLAKMSDDELAQRKREVLDRNPVLKRYLADKDPRSSVMLRSLILKRST